MLPGAFAFAALLGDEGALAMLVAVLPLPRVGPAVRPREHSEAVLGVVDEVAFVHAPIGPPELSTAFPYIVFPFSTILAYAF